MLQSSSLAFASLRDVDTNGRVDEYDILTWRRSVVPDVIDASNHVVNCVFDAALDINADGMVNILDYVLLKQVVAPEMATRGEGLALDGDVVDPNETIVAFDGVVVTTTSSNWPATPITKDLTLADAAALAEGEECPAKLLHSHPYPRLMTWGRKWWEWRNPCGTGMMYTVKLTANEKAGTSVTKHLGCGVTGPQTFTITTSKTVSTTLGTEVGAELEAKFELSFAVTWQAETTVTESVSDSITFDSRPQPSVN